MQIRFCTCCNYQNRDDDFEINQAVHQGIGETKCPNCDSGLWSIVFDTDGIVEITDWDENSIHLRKDCLIQLIERISGLVN